MHFVGRKSLYVSLCPLPGSVIMCKVHLGYHGTSESIVCPSVRSIIPSLKFGYYLSVRDLEFLE